MIPQMYEPFLPNGSDCYHAKNSEIEPTYRIIKGFECFKVQMRKFFLGIPFWYTVETAVSLSSAEHQLKQFIKYYGHYDKDGNKISN